MLKKINFIIFVISCFLLSIFVFSPSLVMASDPPPPTDAIDIREHVIVPFGDFNSLGDIKYEKCTNASADPKTGAVTYCWKIPWLAKYVGNAYRYGVVIGSILAVMMIMIGGVMYLVGGLNPAMISRGKEYIVGAVTGLILLLGSYVLLNTINPNLINLQPIEVEYVKETLMAPGICENIFQSAEWNAKLEVVNYPTDPMVETCGKAPFDIKFKAGQGEGVALATTSCVGMRCPPKKACIDEGAGFICKDGFIWGGLTLYAHGLGDIFGTEAIGTFSAGPAGTAIGYIDYIKLYESDSGVMSTDDSIGETTYKGPPQVSYAIKKTDPNQTFTEELYYLQMEINDASTVAPTIDDTYYIDKKGNPIGVQGDLCCTYECDSTKPGWAKVTSGCDAITGDDLTNNTPIQIDIDTNKMYCKGVPLQEATISEYDIYDEFGNVTGKGRTTYEVSLCHGVFKGKGEPGDSCTTNTDCASGDCEREGSDLRCECNQDADCKPTETCQTSWGDWNQCVSHKHVGAKCTADSDCVKPGESYAACEGGECKCKTNVACPEETVCVASTGKCVKGKKLLEICTDSDECLSGRCMSSSWGGDTPEKRCECDAKGGTGGLLDGCPYGSTCVGVSEGCGWNYCVEKNTKIAGVAADPNTPNMTKPQFINSPAKSGLAHYQTISSTISCQEGSAWQSGKIYNGCSGCVKP